MRSLLTKSLKALQCYVREGIRTNAIHFGLEGGAEGVVAGGREENVPGEGGRHELNGEEIETVELGGQVCARVVQ